MEIADASRVADLIAGQTRVLERIVCGAALGGVLEELTALIEAHAGPDVYASILLLDADGIHLRHGAAPSLPDAYNRAVDGLAIGPSEGSCGTAAYRRERVVVTDIATDPRWEPYRELAAAHGLGACWSTPIIGSSGQTLGTFAIYYPHPQAPRPGELELVDLLTRTAAIAIERYQTEQRLSVQYAVTRVLASADTLSAASAGILNAICDTLGWEAGALWLLDRDADVLRCAELRSHPATTLGEFGAATRGVAFRRGEGLPGHVWASGQPLWVPDLSRDERFPRAPLATKAGLHAAFCVPIAMAGEFLGVMEFFNHAIQTPDDALLAMIAATGSQIGQFVERRRAQTGLLAAEARYRTIFEGVADTILVSDADGRILDANLPATELLGCSLDELRVRRIMDVCAMGDGWIETEFARFLEQGYWRGEAEVAKRDGTRVPVEVRATVAEVHGRKVCISTLRDTSERRAVERLQREFIAMIAHDLKTPLTSIGGYAQLMQRRQAYDQGAATTILSQTRRLERLLSDLLDAAQLETGRLKLRRAPVDLGALVRACVEDVRAAAPAHAFRVDASAAPLEGLWDHDRLMQVLENLLTNAVKYSPEDSEIAVRVADLGDAAEVAVIDQGIGIPPEALPRLFDRFYRTEAATASAARGLGLGLHTAKMLVEAHGGRIHAASAGPGQGSTFTLALPYRPAEA
ncbi:MAG TPA: GAF domain-containing protein [Chloroflexota bacterium]